MFPDDSPWRLSPTKNCLKTLSAPTHGKMIPRRAYLYGFIFRSIWERDFNNDIGSVTSCVQCNPYTQPSCRLLDTPSTTNEQSNNSRLKGTFTSESFTKKRTVLYFASSVIKAFTFPYFHNEFSEGCLPQIFVVAYALKWFLGNMVGNKSYLEDRSLKKPPYKKQSTENISIWLMEVK